MSVSFFAYFLFKESKEKIRRTAAAPPTDFDLFKRLHGNP